MGGPSALRRSGTCIAGRPVMLATEWVYDRLEPHGQFASSPSKLRRQVPRSYWKHEERLAWLPTEITEADALGDRSGPGGRAPSGTHLCTSSPRPRGSVVAEDNSETRLNGHDRGSVRGSATY